MSAGLLQIERPPSAHCPAAAETPFWTEASGERPCPVCRAVRGCSVIEGGEFARCLHATSQWPVLGGGWLHRLAEAPTPGGPAPEGR